MSRRDPRLFGLIGPAERTIDNTSRIAILERGGGGGGTVQDATTVVKGKLKLAGHFAGSADTPILSTTATPQILRLGLNTAAASSNHALRLSGTDHRVFWSDGAFDDEGAAFQSRRDTTEVLPLNTRRAHFRVRHYSRGGGNVSTGWGGFFAEMIDRTDVTEKVVSGATNASPIVLTVTGHGYTTGEQVTVWDVGGNNAANNIFVITVIDANSFSLNGSAGSGAYTSGGKVTNRGQLGGFFSAVAPRIARGGITGPGTFGDDVVGFAAQNISTTNATGTDGFYLGHNSGFAGATQEWFTGFTIDANCLYGINVNGAIGSAGINLSNATYASGAPGLKLTTATSTKEGGIAFGTEMFMFRGAASTLALTPASGNVASVVESVGASSTAEFDLKGKTSANATVQLTAQANDFNAAIGSGSAHAFILRQNGAEVFRLDTSAQVQLATGKRIYGGDGITLKTKAGAIVDGDYTVPTDGMLGVDTANDDLYFRSGGAWFPASGGSSLTTPFTISDAARAEIISAGTSNSGVGSMIVKGKESGGTVIQGDFYAAPNSVNVAATSAHPLIFRQAAAEVFRLNASTQAQFASGKRTGYGVDPASAIHFVSSTTATDGLQFGSDSTPMRLFRGGANLLRFETDGTGGATQTTGIGFNSAAGGTSLTALGAFLSIEGLGPLLDMSRSAITSGFLRGFLSSNHTNPTVSFHGDRFQHGPGGTSTPDIRFKRTGTREYSIEGSADGTTWATAPTLTFPTAASILKFTAGGTIACDATNGLKIGTANTQKLAFFNSTPIVQPIAIAAPTAGAVIDAESRTAINLIRAALTNLGLTA